MKAAEGWPARAHVLFAAEAWPHLGHDQLSVNQVAFELIRAFRQTFDCRVSFVCVYRSDRQPSAEVERKSRAALAEIDVSVFDPITIPEPPQVNSLRRLLWPRVTDYFPEAAKRAVANALVARIDADVVVVPWSERATQLFAEADCLRVAYYGNPDPKNMRVNMLPPIGRSRGPLGDLLMRAHLALFERIHLREMRRYHLIGEVAANDADYYRSSGIDEAFYCRMIYCDRAPADWMVKRDALEPRNPTRIIANIGSQRASGNILAMHYFADNVLEPLQEALGDRLDVVLLGGGKMPPDLARKLARPGVRNAGFVEDIDTELLAAPVFLCLNNATVYKVNQSRYLHVWSLGGCIVAHRDAGLSLPEMVHDKNALLGADAQGIVDCIVKALDGRDLRRRLGQDGRQTFLELFNANAVACDLMNRIEALGRKKSALDAPAVMAA